MPTPAGITACHVPIVLLVGRTRPLLVLHRACSSQWRYFYLFIYIWPFPRSSTNSPFQGVVYYYLIVSQKAGWTANPDSLRSVSCAKSAIFSALAGLWSSETDITVGSGSQPNLKAPAPRRTSTYLGDVWDPPARTRVPMSG